MTACGPTVAWNRRRPTQVTVLHRIPNDGYYIRRKYSLRIKKSLFGDVVLDTNAPLTVTQQIGRQIVSHRTARGMLQGELASKAGLRQSHLSNIEQGKRTISVEVLAVIADGLNCKMADLMPVHQGGKRVA